LYRLDAIPHLIRTLNLVCDTKTLCFLSLEVREEVAHETFFKQVTEYFLVTRIPKSKQDSNNEYCTIYQLKKKGVNFKQEEQFNE